MLEVNKQERLVQETQENTPPYVGHRHARGVTYGIKKSKPSSIYSKESAIYQLDIISSPPYWHDHNVDSKLDKRERVKN